MTAASIARHLIALAGGSFILFGIAYLAQPEAVLALTGSFQLDSNALTDSRATYGGIQLGRACICCFCCAAKTVLPVRYCC